MFEELHTRKATALEQFFGLFRAIFEQRKYIAVKLCLNTNKSRPWKGAIALSRYMLDHDDQYRIDTSTKPGSTGEAEWRFVLHYYRLCGEYLDKAVTVCNDDILSIDLLLLLEQEARENEYVTAYILVVQDFTDNDLVTHISFADIDLFSSQFPSMLVGGMPVDRLKEHHRRLFPDVSPTE
ncbi:MAG: hypothetical protein AAF998_25725 [Bacteroidota bacterium]